MSKMMNNFGAKHIEEVRNLVSYPDYKYTWEFDENVQCPEGDETEFKEYLNHQFKNSTADSNIFNF